MLCHVMFCDVMFGYVLILGDMIVVVFCVVVLQGCCGCVLCCSGLLCGVLI